MQAWFLSPLNLFFSFVLILFILLLLYLYKKNKTTQQSLKKVNAEINNLSNLLTQSEAEWQALFTRVQEGVVIQYDGYILNVNNHFAYMIGMDKNELIGSELSRLLFRDDRVEFDRAITLLRSGVETPKMQVRFRTSLGDLRSAVVNIQKFIYLGKECEIAFFMEAPHHEVPYNQPISKEQHFIALVEELDDMFAIFDMHGVLQWGNASWRSFWGTNSGMEFGSYALFQDPNYEREDLKSALERVSSGLSSRLEDISMLSPKGHTRILNMRFSPVFEASATSSIQCGFAIVQTDITEVINLQNQVNQVNDDMKKFSYRMREFVDKQNDIFNSMSSVLILVSSLGIITHWNKAAEIKFDILRIHALGQSINMLSGYFSNVDQVVKEVINTSNSVKFRAEDGDWLVVSSCCDKKIAVLEIYPK